jgi:hypothetical protein
MRCRKAGGVSGHKRETRARGLTIKAIYAKDPVLGINFSPLSTRRKELEGIY